MQRELVVHSKRVDDNGGERSQGFLTTRWRGTLRGLPFPIACLIDSLTGDPNTKLTAYGKGRGLSFSFYADLQGTSARLSLDAVLVRKYDFYIKDTAPPGDGPTMVSPILSVRTLNKNRQVIIHTSDSYLEEGMVCTKHLENALKASLESGESINVLHAMSAYSADTATWLTDHPRDIRALHLVDVKGLSQQEVSEKLMDGIRVAYIKYKFLKSGGGL